MHVYEVRYLTKFFFCRCHSCCFRWPFYKESKETKNLPLRGRLKYYFVRISREFDTPGWISQSKQSIPIFDWRAEPLSLHYRLAPCLKGYHSERTFRIRQWVFDCPSSMSPTPRLCRIVPQCSTNWINITFFAISRCKRFLKMNLTITNCLLDQYYEFFALQGRNS